MASVLGMPSAVKRLRVAARIWISAMPIEVAGHVRLPNQFYTMHLGSGAAWVVVSRPTYFDARTASFRALAFGVSGFHNLAFLRGAMIAFALRAAIASWHSAP